LEEIHERGDRAISGGDQLYFVGPDNIRVQLSANGYQG